MNSYSLYSTAMNAVHTHADRPATSIVYDAPDARVVTFRIEPGQQVRTHESPSTVLLFVVSGAGLVSDESGERTVAAGDMVVYAPNEPHGMRAIDRRFVLSAVITPRPAAR